MSDETLFILKKLDEDLRRHSDQDASNFKEIADRLQEQTGVLKDIRKDLFRHMEGNIQNREEIKEVRLRVARLEQPEKAKEYVKGFIIETSKLTGAILALATFWKFVVPYIKDWF